MQLLMAACLNTLMSAFSNASARVIATVFPSAASIPSNSCQPQHSVNSTQSTALSDQHSQSSQQGHSGQHGPPEDPPLLATSGPAHLER